MTVRRPSVLLLPCRANLVDEIHAVDVLIAEGRTQSTDSQPMGSPSTWDDVCINLKSNWGGFRLACFKAFVTQHNGKVIPTGCSATWYTSTPHFDSPSVRRQEHFCWVYSRFVKRHFEIWRDSILAFFGNSVNITQKRLARSGPRSNSKCKDLFWCFLG